MSRFQVALIASGFAVALLGGSAMAGASGKVAVLNVEGDQTGQVEDALTQIVEDEHEVVSSHAFDKAADQAGVSTLDTKGIAKVARRLSVAAVIESVLTREDDGYQLLVRVRTAAGKTTKKLTVVMPSNKLTAKDKKSLGDRVLEALDEIDPRSGRDRSDVAMNDDERAASSKRLKKLNGIGRGGDDDEVSDAGDDNAAGDDRAADDDRAGDDERPRAKKSRKSAKQLRAEKAEAARQAKEEKAERARQAKEAKAEAERQAKEEKAAAARAARAEKAERARQAREEREEKARLARQEKEERAAAARAARAEKERAARADEEERDRRAAEEQARADRDRDAGSDGAGDGDTRDRDRDRDDDRGRDRDQVAMRDDDVRASSGDDDDRPRRQHRDDEGVDDGVSARASRRGSKTGPTAAQVEAGASVTGRTLTFNSRAFDQAPQGYKGPVVPGAHFAGAIYPAALLMDRPGLAAGLGIDFDYDKVLSLTTRTTEAVDIELPTREESLRIGVHYRYAFGPAPTAPSVAVGVDYARRGFFVDRSALPAGVVLDIPDTDYKAIAPGIAARVPVTPRIALVGDARLLLFQSAGAIQTQDEYGAAKITGAEGGGGVEVSIMPHVMLRVTGALTYIGYSFVGNGVQTNNRDGDPTTKDVGGALDQYLGGSATLGYAY